MTQWSEIKLPTFKETYGSYENYLLDMLNTTDKIESTNFDVKKVSGGFLCSKINFLHNGLFKKTIAIAFHIPDNNTGLVHHFDVRIFRFKRENKKSKWISDNVFDLREQEVVNLKDFLVSQSELIGKKIEAKYLKIISTDSPFSLEQLDSVLDLVLNNQNIDFSKLSSEGIEKIYELISKILNGENIILERKLFLQLKATQTNKASIANYEKDLQDFKDLINSGTSTETDMQNFLENRVWFFGLNYQQSHRYSKPKFNSTLGSEYDFLLEGFNEVYDIVELKGPNDLLIEEHKTSPRKNAFDDRVDYRFSIKFSRALHQVMDYMDEFEHFFDKIKNSQPSIKNFLYPNGTIVMSKRSLFPIEGKNSIKYLHLIKKQFSNLDFLTYDDLATRAQIIVDFLKATQ